MRRKKIAEKILNTVGKENIIDITHCATRIRFKVKNKNELMPLEEDEVIKGSLYANDQYQVFVRLSDIEEVYNEINNLIE